MHYITYSKSIRELFVLYYTTPMKHLLKSFLYMYLCILAIWSTPALASDSTLEIAGWVPYWRDTQGIKDVTKHLDIIDVVHPFVFTVTTQGELRDQAGLSKKDWKKFRKTAEKKDVAIIPTVMWSDGSSIHSVLSDDTLRTAHIKGIIDMVAEGDYAGVDIDYESKEAETITYFSLFLKELKEELGKKMLTCAIEARTPPDSLYKEVPAVLTYANDYKEIGKYCDRVELMTYDQQRADLKLNAEKAGQPYMPLSDIDWVRKVVMLALVDIPKEKILVGIATYGHHYTVTVSPDWYKNYKKIGALNVPDILDVAKEYKAKPSQNRAGEMSFTYIPKSSDLKLSKSLKIPKDTPTGNIVAARALAYANKTGKTVDFNMAWYSDANAMKQKIDLAKELDLRGVAFFKFDGEEDKKVWNYLK